MEADETTSPESHKSAAPAAKIIVIRGNEYSICGLPRAAPLGFHAPGKTRRREFAAQRLFAPVAAQMRDGSHKSRRIRNRCHRRSFSKM